MALETTDNRKQYSGNGVTVNFAFPYYFLENADLVVILKDNTTGVETLQVLTTNYTITGAGLEAGGTVTMLVAPAAGKTLVIYRDPSIIQDKDFQENDSFPAEQAEEAWDRAAMISQRLAERIGRKIGVSEAFILGSFNLDLPSDLNAVGSEGKVIIVNATLDGFEMGPTADDISNAQGYAAAASASASASANSATASGNSATASAASAAAAALAAASTLWRDVIFLTFSDSPYAVTDAQRGKLLAVDTTGGNVVINLPQISTLDLVTAPFALGVKKTSTDGNTVTLNRAGTDTIDGSTSKVINVAQGGTTLIPDKDPSPDTWTTADFGASAGNLTRDQFNGDNSTTGFSLSVTPGTKNNTFVYISGVYQQKDTYSISGTTITFSEAPPAGSNNIEVITGTLLSIGTPSDNVVTTVKIVDNAVTTAKLAAVTQQALVPVATVLPYAGSAAPSGFLLCDGAAVSRTTYAALFAIVSTDFGVGDGSTTFNVPDTRGIFIRGAGTQSISSISYTATRAAKQGDQMQGHQHTYGQVNSGSDGTGGARRSAAAANDFPNTSSPVTDGSNGTPRTGSETRPANIGLNHIIKI